MGEGSDVQVALPRPNQIWVPHRGYNYVTVVV